MESPFSLFVSCVPGKPVTRYGSHTFIGADRVAGTNEFIWHPERVVAIPATEHARYRKEYDRLLADKDLKVRTETEWKAQTAAEDSAVKRAAAKSAAPKE